MKAWGMAFVAGALALGIAASAAPAHATEVWEVKVSNFPGSGGVMCTVTSPNKHVRLTFFKSQAYVQRTLEFLTPISLRVKVTAQIGDAVFAAPGNDVFYWTSPAIKTAILNASDMTVRWISPHGHVNEKQVDLIDFKEKYAVCEAKM